MRRGLPGLMGVWRGKRRGGDGFGEAPNPAPEAGALPKGYGGARVARVDSEGATGSVGADGACTQ